MQGAGVLHLKAHSHMCLHLGWDDSATRTAGWSPIHGLFMWLGFLTVWLPQGILVGVFMWQLKAPSVSVPVLKLSHSVTSMHSVHYSNMSLPRSKARGISLPCDKEIVRSHFRRAYWVGEVS